MKLENFQTVASLIKDRDYFNTLYRMLDSDTSRIIVNNGAHRNHDLRPELVERMLPEMKLVITQQIAIVEEKLAALGVTAS